MSLPPDEDTIGSAASVYLQNGTSIRSMVHYMLRSREFQNPGNWHTRYSWPVEYVVRAIKEVGWSGFSIDTARTALIPMGQVLFEPPGRERLGARSGMVLDRRHAVDA